MRLAHQLWRGHDQSISVEGTQLLVRATLGTRPVGRLQQIEHCGESRHRAAQRSVIAGAEGEAATRLAVIGVGIADRIEAGEERGRLHGQILFLQRALNLACEVLGHVGGDVADQSVKAGMDGGAVGHGETLTGVKPPSEAKVADGAGWRTKAERLKGRKSLADLAIPTHRPPLKAVGAFSLLQSKSQLPVSLFDYSRRQSRPRQPALARRSSIRANTDVSEESCKYARQEPAFPDLCNSALAPCAPHPPWRKPPPAPEPDCAAPRSSPRGNHVIRRGPAECAIHESRRSIPALSHCPGQA